MSRTRTQTPGHALMTAVAAIFAAEPRAAAASAAPALAAGPPIAGRRLPCRLDAAIRALLAASDHPAARAVFAAQSVIPWGTNPVADSMDPACDAICAVATLMGPESPIPCPDHRLGLFFQSAGSYYPLHNHDADETYVIIAGTALWQAGDEIALRGPGDYMHHPSLMPHAFRAGPGGFLALWRWSGDINTSSYQMLADPLAARA